MRNNTKCKGGTTANHGVSKGGTTGNVLKIQIMSESSRNFLKIVISFIKTIIASTDKNIF